MLGPMAEKTDKPGKAPGMKSAYELALERIEKQGIERPREGFSEEAREKIAEARRQAEAKLAELEILHKDRLRLERDPGKRMESEEEYRRERRRIEENVESKVEKLRAGA
jgi:hypothetical protein